MAERAHEAGLPHEAGARQAGDCRPEQPHGEIPQCYAKRIANKLDSFTIPAQLDDGILLDEVRWLSALMAAFARYGEEDFDAVERILGLERE